jgi:hypothetical protein
MHNLCDGLDRSADSAYQDSNYGSYATENIENLITYYVTLRAQFLENIEWSCKGRRHFENQK